MLLSGCDSESSVSSAHPGADPDRGGGCLLSPRAPLSLRVHDSSCLYKTMRNSRSCLYKTMRPVCSPMRQQVVEGAGLALPESLGVFPSPEKLFMGSQISSFTSQLNYLRRLCAQWRRLYCRTYKSVSGWRSICQKHSVALKKRSLLESIYECKSPLASLQCACLWSRRHCADHV